MVHHIMQNTIPSITCIAEAMAHNTQILSMKPSTNWTHLIPNVMVKKLTNLQFSFRNRQYIFSICFYICFVAEFIQQQQRGAVSEKESVCTRKENTNYALVKKTPPPLPPRNSDNQGHISLGNNPLPYVGNSSALRENTYGHYDNIQIDQRKTKTRLYERLSNHCTFDPELFDFYLMVKNVRQQYPYDDRSTNIGHIIAAEFNYHYLPDTNIKILVYPSIDIITNTCSMESKSIGKQPIKGYGKPAIFTCNSKSEQKYLYNTIQIYY